MYIKLILKQVRLTHWIKNSIIFLPVFANQQILDVYIIKNSLIGFFSFSMLASSIYVFNDIIDFKYDSLHPTKKKRPIASKRLSMLSGYAILIVCFIIGEFYANILGLHFFLIANLYVGLNILYSLFLKRVVILDIIIIMSFYTLRLIAGHVPDNIPFSPWLLSFFIFLFFSLGLLKRYSDIIIMKENGISSLGGRNYRVSDDNILMTLGISSGLISSLVLILYTGSDQVLRFYSSPMFLVTLAPLLLYWNSRIWLMAERGFIKKDPVVFVIKDLCSYLVAAVFLLIILISKYKIY